MYIYTYTLKLVVTSILSVLTLRTTLRTNLIDIYSQNRTIMQIHQLLSLKSGPNLYIETSQPRVAHFILYNFIHKGAESKIY
jgi:hypothetical protein